MRDFREAQNQQTPSVQCMQPNQVQWPKRIAEMLRGGFFERFFPSLLCIRISIDTDAVMLAWFTCLPITRNLFAENVVQAQGEPRPCAFYVFAFHHYSMIRDVAQHFALPALGLRCSCSYSTGETPIADINECGRGLCVCITYVFR